MTAGIAAVWLALVAGACGVVGGTSAGDEVMVADGAGEDEDPEVQKDISGLDLAELIPTDIPGPEDLPPATADGATAPTDGDGPDAISGTAPGADGVQPGADDIVGAHGSGEFCDGAPGAAVESALGGAPDQTTGAGDSCTWVRVSNEIASVLSLSVTDAGEQLNLSLIVESTVEGIDADGVAEAVDGVGDGAFLMAGDLGTYLYAQDGTDLLVAFANDTPDDRDAVVGIVSAIIAR